jgi:large conductance mechanosensitive channel
MFKEFKDFIARGNVMDMAVGIIMGAAFTAIVNSMVGDLIMPVIGLLTAGVDFADQYIALSAGSLPSLMDAQTVGLKAAQDAGATVITYGIFINAVINFLIISIVVFMLVKGVNKLKKMAEEEQKAAAPSAPPADVVLLSEIRDLLAKK